MKAALIVQFAHTPLLQKLQRGSQGVMHPPLPLLMKPDLHVQPVEDGTELGSRH
jgi:hypothetical protein